jgi:hypothetical protein
MLYTGGITPSQGRFRSFFKGEGVFFRGAETLVFFMVPLPDPMEETAAEEICGQVVIKHLNMNQLQKGREGGRYILYLSHN